MLLSSSQSILNTERAQMHCEPDRESKFEEKRNVLGKWLALDRKVLSYLSYSLSTNVILLKVN